LQIEREAELRKREGEDAQAVRHVRCRNLNILRDDNYDHCYADFITTFYDRHNVDCCTIITIVLPREKLLTSKCPVPECSQAWTDFTG
jgi:hypothetical protein